MEKEINWELFQDMYDMGLTDEEIASEMDADKASVRKHRKSLGLPPTRSKAEARSTRCSHRKVPVKSLVEVAREAKERGMSYGQYMVAQREGCL